MSRYKSKQTAYCPKKKKNVPLWQLDTNTLTVTWFDAETCTTDNKAYCSDYVKYHLSYSANHQPDRLRRLVNDGSIISYLDDLERKVGEAIDRQVELWKESDKEYQAAVECGDIQKAAGLENCLVYMAREAIFECMVYI